jgi:hypothetical protein
LTTHFGEWAESPDAPRESWRPGREDWRNSGICLLILISAGLLVGLIWAWTAHRINVGSALDGDEAAFGAQFSVDLWFGALSLIVGLGLGVLLWFITRPAGWLVPVAIAAGGLAGAWLASIVGAHVNHKIPGLPASGATDLGHILLDFRLRAKGFLVVYPAAALLTFLALDGGLASGARHQPPSPGSDDPADGLAESAEGPTAVS